MKQGYIVLLFGLLVFSACNVGSGSSKPIAKSYTDVGEGQYSTIKEVSLLVVKSADENQKLHSNSFIAENNMDRIDFGKNMLVQIFIGEQMSAGYAIEVDSILANHEALNVYYSIIKPEGMFASVMTQPYKIIQMSKSDLTPVFINNRK